MEELFKKLIEYAADDYDTEQDSFLLSLIESATKEVTRKLYKGQSFRNTEERKKAEQYALVNYDDVILKIAKFHYDKQGREGVVAFSEGGSSTTYESGGTPPSFLADVIPIAIVVH